MRRRKGGRELADLPARLGQPQLKLVGQRKQSLHAPHDFRLFGERFLFLWRLSRLEFLAAHVLECEQARAWAFGICTNAPLRPALASQWVKALAAAGAIRSPLGISIPLTVWREVCRQLLDERPKMFVCRASHKFFIHVTGF